MKETEIVQRIPIRSAPGQQLAMISTAPEGTEAVDPTDVHTPHLLFCAGFHSNMRGTKCEALNRHATEHSYHFTRFDYRAHGESDGDAISCTLQDWLDDTLTVIDATEGPLILIGSSMGAWLATHAALARPDRIVGLLLIAAAPDFVTELIEPHLDHQQRWQLETGETVFLPSNYDEPPRPITERLLDSGRELALLDTEKLSVLDIPVRLIHGTGDKDVPWQFSERLMRNLGGDARLNLLHRADHRLSDEKSLEIIKQTVLELINATKRDSVST